MCLAKIYVGGKEKEPLMEEIASLQVEDGRLRVKTLFGEEREIEGGIKEIDFMTSNVILT